MPVAQVQVGPPPNTNLPNGMLANALGGTSGEVVGTHLHWPSFVQTYRKNLWTASNAVGSPVAIPLMATNATPTFGIFNPAGNTTAVVLVRWSAGFTAGTGIAGSIGYAYLNPAGTVPAGTAAPASTYTAGPSIKMGVCGSVYGGNILFGTSFTIGGVVSALTLHRWSPIGQGAPITSTAGVFSIFEDFNGSVIVPPNTLWCPVASVAIAETFQQSLTAYEVPWP